MPSKRYYNFKSTGDTGIEILDEFGEALQKMLDEFPEERLKIMNEVADVLIDHIKPLTPVNYDPPDGYEHVPGRLRRSIHKKVTHGYAVVKTGERYAHLVEAGHVIANKKVESANTINKGKNKGRYKMRPQVLGFVRGRWMFKKGTAMASLKIRSMVDEFAKRVTDK